MYVQWLLEFVWRIFIQGPLLLINWFTSGGLINKLSSTIGFGQENEGWEGINSFINIGITLAIFIIFFIFVFLFKLFKTIIVSSQNEIKKEILNLFKDFGKLLMVSFLFILFFQFVFLAFDSIARAIDKGLNSIENKYKDKISTIPNLIYSLITNGQEAPKNNSFLFPSENFLEIANGINFIISILFVLCFAGFLIWIVWSIFQKMLEVSFLYLSFPISIATSLESQKVNWKIWSKEIFNKLILILVLMLFLRFYLYAYYFIYTGIIKANSRWNSKGFDYLYLSFFVTIALGSSMVFVTKMFSSKSQENIGLFTSFKQTQNFIKNYQINKIVKSETIKLEPINSNIKNLRNEVTKINATNHINYANLKKIKLFNK